MLIYQIRSMLQKEFVPCVYLKGRTQREQRYLATGNKDELIGFNCCSLLPPTRLYKVSLLLNTYKEIIYTMIQKYVCPRGSELPQKRARIV